MKNFTFRARNPINEDEVEQRGDSPALVMHDGVIKSIFAHLFPAQGVDFPSCERCGLDNLGYYRVVFQCDNEPSTSAFLRAVKLTWTGDVVQEVSAVGDSHVNGAAEGSERHQRTCQIDHAGGAVSFGC